jgi:hypothetical protein
MMANLSSKI